MAGLRMIDGGGDSNALPDAGGTSVTQLVLVDDDVIDSKLLQKALQARKDVKITHFSSATATDHIWQDETYEQMCDAVLIDLEMPRVNGFELLDMIRKRLPSSRRPLLVAYSGCLNSIEPSRLDEFDNAFEKPISIAEMNTIIDRIIKQVSDRKNGYSYKSAPGLMAISAKS